MSNHAEKILVIPRDALIAAVGGPLWHGYLPSTALSPVAILRDCQLMVRAEAEQRPDYKQIIPYTIFTYALGDGNELAFLYTRGVGGGESRLHRQRSLGVGGHVDEADLREEDPGRYSAYMRAWQRELAEEVAYDAPKDPGNTILGYLNDDTPDPDPTKVAVGQVHLGIVHRIRLTWPRVVSREGHALTEAGFASGAVLASLHDQFETWSRFLIDTLWPRR